MQAFIEKEKRKMADRETQEETDLVAEFKELIERQKMQSEEDEKIERLIPRKQKNPIANKVNFEMENKRMEIKNEVDLLLHDKDREIAAEKYDKELFKFS